MTKLYIGCCDKSGSVWLAETLKACCPQADVFHELHSFGLVDWQMAVAYYTGRIDADAAREYLTASRSYWWYDAERRGQSAYIEVSSCLFPFLQLLDGPESFCATLTRDGRAVVRSGLNIGWYTHAKQSFDFVEPLRLRPRVSGGSLVPWESMSAVARAAWYWNEVNRHMGRDPSRFKLEALTGARGADEANALLQPCGLTVNPGQYDGLKTQPRNVTADKTVGPFDTWPIEDQRDFWRYAGPMMQELGYV